MKSTNKRILFYFISKLIDHIDETYTHIKNMKKVEEYKDKAKDIIDTYTPLDIERSYEREKRLNEEREKIRNDLLNKKINIIEPSKEEEMKIQKEETRMELLGYFIPVILITALILLFKFWCFIANLEF